MERINAAQVQWLYNNQPNTSTMNNLTPTNWQEVQSELIARFNGKACNSEFTKLKNALNFEQLFSVVFENYSWLKDREYEVAEIENITPIQYSTFMVWVLKTYCLGKDVDNVVQTVIGLHKQRLNGVEPTEKEWYAASSAAWAAASSASSAARAARAAAWAAASSAAWAAAWDAARDAAWSAAREQITNKLIEIIYE
jgi:hypothetical protein